MAIVVLVTWRDKAQCKGTDHRIFFPFDVRGMSAEKQTKIDMAKSVCKPCPVRLECLSWALETNQIDGILGGMTPAERKRLRRRSA